MMRKIVLIIVILAMLLSCRAVTGQPEQSQTSTPASQAQIDKPTEVIPPTPHPEETPLPLGAELQSDRDLDRIPPKYPDPGSLQPANGCAERQPGSDHLPLGGR